MMTSGSRNSMSAGTSGAATGGSGAPSTDCANTFFSFDEFPNQSRINSPLQNPPVTISLPPATSDGDGIGGQTGQFHSEPTGSTAAPPHMASIARAKLERAAQYHAFHAKQQLQQQQLRRTPLDDVFADIPPSPLSSLLLGGSIASFQHHHPHQTHTQAQAQAQAQHMVFAARPYSHLPLSHPNDPANSNRTPSATAPTPSSLGFTNYTAASALASPSCASASSSSSSSNPLVFSTTHKPPPSSSASIPLSPYTSSLLLPLDMYAATPEGKRHHIHLMDSPAMSSLLLHPHIAPSAGTLTPTPLATLPGGVCADPKLLCAPGASSSSSSSAAAASTSTLGHLPPAASAFAYQQHQGTGYFHHVCAATTQSSMSASSSVASALSMAAAIDPAIASGTSSRFTSPAGAFRALSAPPMVESRAGSPVRDVSDDLPVQLEEEEEQDAMEHDEESDEHPLRQQVAGLATRRITRRTRQSTDEDQMDVDQASDVDDMAHAHVKLEPNVADMQDHDTQMQDLEPESDRMTRTKRPVGRPRKTRGRPRRAGPESEPAIEVELAIAEVPATRSKRTAKRGVAKTSIAAAKEGGLISGLGDALLLTAASKSTLAVDGNTHHGSDAEDHRHGTESVMQSLLLPPPPPPPQALAAQKPKTSKKRSRASSASNPPAMTSMSAATPDRSQSHLTYPKSSQVVGQVNLFPHPLDARVTDLRRHFKSRNSFGSGALELALSAAPTATSSTPTVPSPLSASTSAALGGGDDDEHEDDGKPKTTEEAKALGLSKDAIRQLRNKISARNFRQRKKQYIHTLEDQVLDLKRQLAEEVRARVQVEAKLNQCERQLGVPETPGRGEWPVGWREEVGRIGMAEGEHGEDDGDDAEDEEGDGDEGVGRKKKQRVRSAEGKKDGSTTAAEGAGEATGKKKASRKSSAAKNVTALAEPEPEPSMLSRQSSAQPNQVPMPAGHYFPPSGTATNAMIAMPPGIYSPLQQQHLSTSAAAASTAGVYPSTASAPGSATTGYPVAHPYMAYHQHMHSASAQAAISHARRAAAAAVSAAMNGQQGLHQHGQGPQNQVGSARR